MPLGRGINRLAAGIIFRHICTCRVWGVFSMRVLRRTVGIGAIIAIALHGLLFGLVSLAAAATNDPFTIICHSIPHSTSSDDQSPANPGTADCDHCTLCNATATPPALDDVRAGQLIPARLLQVLRPVSNATEVSLAGVLKLARGPPQSV